MTRAHELAQNFRELQSSIAAACGVAGRPTEDVTLVAVSKTFPAEDVRILYDLGHRDFGESRVQELLPKLEDLPDDIRWHFIGKLQSNKLKKIASNVELLHSLETESQLHAANLNREPFSALIEINIAEEPQKSGILPSALDSFQKSVIECSTVRLKGLMTIGPANRNAEEMRLHFRRLRQLSEVHGTGKVLSMGMSGDYAIAIQEGSTHIRVGTALFGGR